MTFKQTGRARLIGLGLGLGLLCLMNGVSTYGFQDSTQHKTNELATTLNHRDVTLIGEDDLTSQLVNDWQPNQSLRREIRVKNGVKDSSEKFEPLYVRVSLKEFLELMTEEKTYSTTLYLLDDAQKVRYFASKAEAEQFVTANSLQASLTVEQVITESATKKEGENFPGYWYLAVKGTLPTGLQGGRLVLKTTVTSKTSLIAGVDRADQDARDNHHAHSNGENDYTSHLFDYDLSAFGASQAFEDYIALGFSQDVISLDDWLSSGAKPVAKWLVDTRNTNGWVYWGELLPADATTSNLLETVTLRDKAQGKSVYYAINARLQAVDRNELAQTKNWQDLPPQLRNAWLAN